MAKRKLKRIIETESEYLNPLFLRRKTVIFTEENSDGVPEITLETNLLALQDELKEGLLSDPDGLYEIHQAGRKILVLIKGGE